MLISERSIILGLDVKTKDEAIEKLAWLAYQNGSIKDEKEFIESVYEREAISSTYCDNLIAIPHGKSKSVIEPFIVFAKLKNIITWDEDEEKTNCVFMIGVPDENEDNIHLRLISSLCKKLADDEVIDFLNSEDITADKVIKFFD